MPVDDYYSLIGVSPDADRDTIRDAYRARRSELDDSEQGRSSAAKLNRAWNVLSDSALALSASIRPKAPLWPNAFKVGNPCTPSRNSEPKDLSACWRPWLLRRST